MFNHLTILLAQKRNDPEKNGSTSKSNRRIACPRHTSESRCSGCTIKAEHRSNNYCTCIDVQHPYNIVRRHGKLQCFERAVMSGTTQNYCTTYAHVVKQ